MLEIKTILEDFNHVEDFDSRVNEAIKDGWELVRREVIPGWEGDTVIAFRKLYAELERGRNTEEEEEPEGNTLDCTNCKHFHKAREAEPCLSCDVQNDIPSNWEAQP